ncbi:cytochrome C biogenesis protein ResB [Clostridium thermosuccinogenes]|uniref:Cytochrome C biogenesis protein ResB n=1 Tax=Clostridium thermosuccinogenes TaxID=84032 RepID=A0A2K2FHK0_9CLOT|nr:cytochrome c biogenesis CcdA family protein [Pseudoclostridium thermosuccinogenes]AUS95539.1 cytochrome C biogenesis protein ResB [Pseudoclostridium thermosuccinogenes]PNT96507.1 cytochrome C biogenesis protein ResB [Pseudoclostridium thermosuccinogenes]PNT98250.1 cytochrome C biogenesis protein ResB [Pseudoclostridium thermosuccinogenes]
MNSVYYLLTFTEGVLTFISPCILPMLPIYFSYLAGTSGNDKTQNAAGKSNLLANSFAFVLGFTLVFVALGATVTTLGHFLINNRSLLQKISGLIMMVFGLSFMGILNLKFLNMEKRLDFKFEKLRFFSSILFGMVFGFGWTPCLGTFLGSALALASSSKTITQGVLLLLVYSIGLGIPFILTSVLFEKVKGAFKLIQKHSRTISIVSGILLVIAGILVFTDSLKYMSFQ